MITNGVRAWVTKGSAIILSLIGSWFAQEADLQGGGGNVLFICLSIFIFYSLFKHALIWDGQKAVDLFKYDKNVLKLIRSLRPS